MNPAIEGELIATTSPEFKIKVSTGSAITLKVGEQISEVILPNTNGEYIWSPVTALEKGLNTLEVIYSDGNNQEKKVSRTFNVLAAGDISGLPAFTATPSATVTTPEPTPTEATTMPETDDENLEDAGSFEQIVAMVFVGLILIIGGNILKKKWQ